MTPELEARWRDREAPFDGRSIVTADEPDLNDLLGMLRFAVESLRRDYPNVLAYGDWHEHDGYLTSPRPFEWSELAPSLQSAEALYAARDADEYVRIAFYPATFEWLLRFNIDDADSAVPADAWCSLEFSCTPKSKAETLLDEMHSRWPGYTDVMPARDYFDNSYAG